VSRRTTDGLLALALFALPLLVFAPVVGFEFLNFDDDVYVTRNPAIRAGLTWDTVRWAFSNVESGHFHPLTWLTHALDVTLFGLDAGAHHRTTLLLHGVATVLCFTFWSRLGISRGVSVFAAALFAIHPLRIESVAWVSTRKDVLSGALFFVTLLCWLHWRARPSLPRLALTTFSFLCALLAKPTVLPLPALLLVLEVWPLGAPSYFARLKDKLPLFALSLIFAGVAAFGQARTGAMRSLDSLPLGSRLANASVALITYAGRLFAPTEVSLFHPMLPLPVGLGVVCGLIILGVTFAALRGRLPQPVTMAWFWFVLLLLPVCGLVQIGGQFIADRWLYLPLSGVVVGLTTRLPGPRSLHFALGFSLVVIAIGLTRRELPNYRTSELVFSHALAVQPNNFLAHTNLGNALESRGALDEASLHYEEAVRLNPTWPTALNNLGNTRARQQRLPEAEALYRRALEREPTLGLAHYNLALTLVMQGRRPEAVPHYAEAVRLRPNDAMAAVGYGAALMQSDQLAAGLTELKRSVALDANSAEGWSWLERAQRMSGDLEAAEASSARARALIP
jgi:tetratricopeptide (TPR) repeat protein